MGLLKDRDHPRDGHPKATIATKERIVTKATIATKERIDIKARIETKARHARRPPKGRTDTKDRPKEMIATKERRLRAKDQQERN